MRLPFLVAGGVLSSAILSVSPLIPQAWADTFTVSILQSGNDVVATGSGALSVSGSVAGSFGYVGVSSYPPLLALGSGPVSVYTGVSGPSEFGIGGPVVMSSSSMGGEVGIDTPRDEFFVPFGYVAGASLTSSDTWTGATLHDLALTVGSYTYTLASGDRFVVDIGPQTAIMPEPSTFLLLGTGLLGATGVVRRRVVLAHYGRPRPWSWR